MPNQIEVNQIYDLCNQIFQQMTGRTDIEAVDSASLVAMGNEVSNLGKNDLWLNTLARRIGLTIVPTECTATDSPICTEHRLSGGHWFRN